MKPYEIYFYRERIEANFSQSEQKSKLKILSALNKI